jgi:thiosulfate/3-mercaptopyruvate sulfurtransferase
VNTPLVSTSWLAEHLNDSNLRIIDIRGKVVPATQPPPHYFSHGDDYKESHIPNAVFVDWTVDIIELGSPSNDVSSPERFAGLMGELGIDADTVVVIYDDAASMFAARLWWALQYYGHEQVVILDGGWKKWAAEGLPINALMPQIEKKTFAPQINQSLKATADDILAKLESDNMQLVDVRSPKEFAGQASRAELMGHIPSAINLPRKTMIADNATLLSKDDLIAHFSNLGISLDTPDTVIYCNSGVSASYGMLAMQVAGATNIRVYDGSWKEWGNDASKPIVKSQ